MCELFGMNWMTKITKDAYPTRSVVSTFQNPAMSGANIFPTSKVLITAILV
jgi:hypothetical protein